MEAEESEEPAAKKQAGLEEDLAGARKEFAEWSAMVKKAILEGNEKMESKAKEREAFFLKRMEDVQKQVAALRVAPSPASLRVLGKVKFENRDTFLEFFAKELQQRATKRERLDSQTIRESTMISFSTSLFNDNGLPQTVFIRECYRKEADKVHEWMGTHGSKTGDVSKVFVGGARGVGKSIFGALMVFEFVDLEHAVLYEHKQLRMLLFGSKLREDQREDLIKAFTEARYDPSILNNPGVYQFRNPDDTALFNDMILYNHVIHVLDLGDGAIAQNLPTTGKTRRLILSSPRETSLKNLPKLNCEYIIMPRRTLDELKQARACCYPSLTDEMVGDRFTKYGGVARHVLEHTDAIAGHEFKRQLIGLSPSDLDSIMRIKTYNQLPSLRDVGYLIHVIPQDGPNGSEFTCVFASEYAFQEIVRVFLLNQQYKAEEFGHMLKSHPDAATLYARWLEETAHRMLAVGGNFVVHELDDDVAIDPVSGPVHRTLVWPALQDTVFFDDISHLESIQVNVYYRPNSKRYETIDSFVLMDGFLLNPQKYTQGTIVVILLQVTVSKKHRVNGASIKRIHEDVFKKWIGSTAVPQDLMEALPRVMVFPTRRYPNGIHQYQMLTKQDKQAYAPGNAPELPQYSLVLERDFESVWVAAEGVIVE